MVMAMSSCIHTYSVRLVISHVTGIAPLANGREWRPGSVLVQELKARLEFVEEKRRVEVEMTRASIMRKKQERVETLTRKAANLRHVRELSAAQAAARRAAAAAAEAEAAEAAAEERDDRIVATAGKLAEKRRTQAAERAAAAAEAKRVAFLQQQQATGASEVRPHCRGHRIVAMRPVCHSDARPIHHGT